MTEAEAERILAGIVIGAVTMLVFFIGWLVIT